jgi:hypothetical protein
MRVVPGRGGAHRRPSRMVAAAVLAVAATVAVAWLVTAGPSATARTDPGLGYGRYDGETLMLGMFFGLGPVADEHPRLVLTQVDDTPENREHVREVIAVAATRDPELLDRFRSAMYSGEPDVIAETATESLSRLYLTVAKPNGSGMSLFHDPIEALRTIASTPILTTPEESPVDTNGRPNAHPTIVRWARLVASTLRPGP